MSVSLSFWNGLLLALANGGTVTEKNDEISAKLRAQIQIMARTHHVIKTLSEVSDIVQLQLIYPEMKTERQAGKPVL